MPVIRKMRIVNPHRKHRRRNKRTAATVVRRKRHSARAKRTRSHKRNPLGSEVLLMINGKKRKRHSRRRHRKSNPAVSHKRRRRSNPRLRHSRRHHARNPHLAGFDLMSVAKLGGGAAVGSIATRGLTQMVLGDKNTGYMGYGANIAVALGLSWLAKKFVGKEVATGVAAGGIAAVILRYYTENVSQTSPNLSSGMGDLEFSGSGLGQYLALDSSVPYTALPYEQGGSFQVSPAAAAAGAAMVTGGGRFKSSRT